MSKVVLHWFRRDLRLLDNTALQAATRAADVVVPVFVLDPRILDDPSVGAPRVAYLLEALQRLREDLDAKRVPLVVRRGSPAREIASVAQEVGAKAVFANRDYSPYALRRDRGVVSALDGIGVEWRDFSDLLLVEPWDCRKDDGTPYTVFTPYSRRWRAQPKASLARRAKLNPVPKSLEVSSADLPEVSELGRTLTAAIPTAGEKAAAKRLRAFVDARVGRYASDRDRPDLAGTSGLSVDLRFGTISVRRVYHAVADFVGEGHAALDPKKPERRLAKDARARLENGGTFLSELCWRDFYYAVLFHFPHVLGAPFREYKEGFRWPSNDPGLKQAWVDGRTGFPIVDAGMRQLAATGWMHNRVRMLTASFLTKILLVDWRFGERVFLERLVDGDPAANNGGWQWSASTGTDAAPYFRIFNPTLQSKKFDPNGDYIRAWVPELRPVAAPLIHEPGREPRVLKETGYPPPCVDYPSQRKRALEVLAKL